ncbi:23746_t:CDS:2 [Cetraspora pellucida]|uniref:23746_t:CDS:1 n=1 Tax=Cetraspora pellucida TaxID=1433469 RepID=A0A9N9B264_9GLOM|nr:23746_t:CDS:2 [Cetraspora pellucida]
MQRESSVYGTESPSRQDSGNSAYDTKKDSMSDSEKGIQRPPELTNVFHSLNQRQKDLYNSLPDREAKILLTMVLEEKKRGVN